MRIILSIDYSPWSDYSGGAQQATHNLASALVRRDHHVTVIYTKAFLEKINIPDNLPYELVWGTFLSTKSKRKAFLRPLSAFSVKNRVRDLIQDEENVIVHCNGEEGGLIHQLRADHNFTFICTPHHPHYPDVFFKTDRLTLYQYFKLALTNGKFLMQRSALQHADYCTPPSQWSANMVQRAFNLNDKKLIPISNGVTDLFLDYSRTKHASNGPIVFFGRLTYTKGVDTLIEALHLLKEELPQTIIVGRGDLERSLKDLVKKYGLEDKVVFKPWLSQPDLAKLLSNARMTILPSRQENFSLAILESMCIGSPTISTKVGGTPEIIHHLDNGYLVSPGRPSEIAKAIQLFIRKPEFAEALGDKASQYIREELTWDRTAERFESIYMDAIANQPYELTNLHYT